MPEVNGMHFPYTKKGRKAAKRARNKKYSMNAVKMARVMGGNNG